MQDKPLSFSELLYTIELSNKRLSYHLQILEEFCELEPLTRKYHLTERGKLLAAAIKDFTFIATLNGKLSRTLQELGFGDHVIGLYEKESFMQRMVRSFLNTGFLRNEAILYLVSDYKLDSEIRNLERYLITNDCLLPQGAFTIKSATEWYLKEGKADPKIILKNVEKFFTSKKKAGFSGIRVAGETSDFFEQSKVEELFRYEESIGRQIPIDACGLCLYKQSMLDESQLSQILNYHGYMISKDVAGKIP